MTISEMYALKSKYEAFRDNVSKAIGTANAVIEGLVVPISNIASSYTINDVPVDNGKVKTASDNLKSQRDTMNNVVLPAIVAKIKSLGDDIAAAEKAEAERKKAEEEAKKRASSSTGSNNSNSSTPSKPAPGKPTKTSNAPSKPPGGDINNVPEQYRKYF